jgi:uncharacterized metal-binding protein YceD (DUF177 family)
MQILDQYKIQFSGLKNEVYHYDFEITDSFFEVTAFPEVKKGNLTASVTLNKQVNMMILDFHIQGEVELMCDRCLDFFTFTISSKDQLIVKQVVELQESNDDNLIYIDMQAHTLDLVQHFYDYIAIALPMQRIHPEDENGKSACNQEMIDRLAQYSAPIYNSQWDALKNLSRDN